MRLIYINIISVILGISTSLFSNLYVQHRYEIDESITQEKIEIIYGETLSEIESLYEIESNPDIKIRVKQLEDSLPKHLGILKLYQRDKDISYFSYGVNYFGFELESYQHSYFYTNSSFISVNQAVRGYVENSDGDEIDALQYKRIIGTEDEILDIQMVVDYKKLLGLVNAL